MHISFCGCGGLLAPSKGALVCRACGKATGRTAEARVVTEAARSEVVVIEDNKPDLPVTDKECPRCASAQAWYWLIQTRSSDEPPTQFFRCTQCRHVWREYK